MSQFHKTRDKTKHSDTCQECNVEASRYIHNDTYWCRECLDKHDYPHLAHLSQVERDDMRMANAKNVRSNGMVNANNLSTKIGF